MGGSGISVYSDFLIQSVISLIRRYHLMPFLEKVGFVFNCGFCRTLVFEYCAKIEKNNTAGKKTSEEALGKKNEGDSSGEPSLNFTKTSKLYFQGPRFTVGDSYFDRSKGRTLQFERHVGIVIKSFNQNFVPRTENGLRDKYLATFSSNNWNKLTPAEKAAHSLSNYKACALNSPKEQKSFPLKPTFIVHENDHVTMKSLRKTIKTLTVYANRGLGSLL